MKKITIDVFLGIYNYRYFIDLANPQHRSVVANHTYASSVELYVIRFPYCRIIQIRCLTNFQIEPHKKYFKNHAQYFKKNESGNDWFYYPIALLFGGGGTDYSAYIRSSGQIDTPTERYFRVD